MAKAAQPQQSPVVLSGEEKRLSLSEATPFETVTSPNEKQVLVLQGGGALGAYQAGAYAGLLEAGIKLDWVAGISIGSINACIIAGNEPEQRVEKLRQFWEGVSSGLQGQSVVPGDTARTLFNETSSMIAMFCGIPGFFIPHVPPPFLAWPGTPGALSYYDTAPLYKTLNELIDFAELNSGKMRVSLGAVNIKSGNFHYFDSCREPLEAAHIVASSALPPGFGPVEIAGEYYWDGGLVSNTPLQIVIDDHDNSVPLCIYQIDLFPAKGELPQTIFEVAEREKEIRYSSRTRYNTDAMRQIHNIRQAAKRLMQKLPEELRNDPDAQFLLEGTCKPAITIMHLIKRSLPFHTQSKDYEFSRLSIMEHWQRGYADVTQSLNHAAWRERHLIADAISGNVKIFDLTRNQD